ncbi:hypothetical protein C8R45DRAFT_1129651 [Mycena sanguinolenta]|nr:hypothetical protein C8R45DRAFT_1129651 [Mycena sanguinolenta]
MEPGLLAQPSTRFECLDCGKAHSPRAVIPSPFQSIITQELLPTAYETAAIRDFLLDTDAEIDHLQCEVAVLRRRSEQHKYILAPIRRVPPEIMAEIFLNAIDAGPGMDRYPDRSGCDNFFAKHDKVKPVLHRAPLIFGEVSRRWRAIALSTPRLWNSILINCTDEKLQDYISLCDMWLKRSGSLPLSIRFHRSPTEDVPQRTTDDCKALLRTILPYAHRWRLLDFAHIPASSYDVLRHCPPYSLPIFEALSVRYAPPAGFSCKAWAVLRNAPNLRFFRHDSISDTRAEEWQTFPWSQITQIDLGNCSTYDCLRILSAAPTAMDCRFSIERTSAFQHPPVTHSALKTLRIEVHTNIHLDLTCPRLSTLKIDIYSSEFSFHDFPSFIARSGPSIQGLTLAGSSIDDDQFMACLVDMPNLRHLSVSEYGQPQFTDGLWGSLTSRSNSTPLLPDLESLEYYGGGEFNFGAVALMLESRVQMPHTKLKAIDLAIRRRMSGSACRRLEAFGQFGLEISVRHGVEPGTEDDSDDES